MLSRLGRRLRVGIDAEDLYSEIWSGTCPFEYKYIALNRRQVSTAKSPLATDAQSNAVSTNTRLDGASAENTESVLALRCVGTRRHRLTVAPAACR